MKTPEHHPRTALHLLFAFVLLAAFAGLFFLRTQQRQHSEITLADAASRTAWLNLRGWRVGEETQSETRIPYTWQTAAGKRWLELQHAQGLFPEQFGGRAALRCVYPVENSGGGMLCAELLLCEGELVGAQVYNAETQIMQSVQ